MHRAQGGFFVDSPHGSAHGSVDGIVISIITIGTAANSPTTRAFGTSNRSIGVGVIVGGTHGRDG